MSYEIDWRELGILLFYGRSEADAQLAESLLLRGIEGWTLVEMGIGDLCERFIHKGKG